MKPDYAQAFVNLGNTLKQLERPDEVEACYREAIALKADYVDAHFNLGVRLHELGRLIEAEASYRRAVALKPDFAKAHFNLSVSLAERSILDDAEVCVRRAIVLMPDYIEAHYTLGNILKEVGRLDEAEASYQQALALRPEYIAAHLNMGNTMRELGRADEAKASYQRVIALKPEHSSAKHLLAALSGNTTASAPLDYVEELFDYYAPKFEKSLVNNLGYQVPKVISAMILQDSRADSLGSISDLGCGTGLLGAEIKEFCGYLEGVDLSQKMLNEAKTKNVYDELIKKDILTYLTTADLHFDYFVATDVFIYVGDLTGVFRLIKSRNKQPGKLVFSTENYDGTGFFLEQSGRYSHSNTYIEDLCQKFGYVIRHFETQALRKQNNVDISGGLYILDF